MNGVIDRNWSGGIWLRCVSSGYGGGAGHLFRWYNAGYLWPYFSDDIVFAFEL